MPGNKLLTRDEMRWRIKSEFIKAYNEHFRSLVLRNPILEKITNGR